MGKKRALAGVLESMTESLPIAYLRIWAQKNQMAVSIERKSSDKYMISKEGVFLIMPDGTMAPVNARQVFPVIERFPALLISDLVEKSTTPTRQFYLIASKSEDKLTTKALSFEQVRAEVESYLSLITHLDPVQLYVAVRAYETGLVGLPHLNRVAGMLTPNTTLGTQLLQQNLCSWEDLLAVCLDLRKPTPKKGGQAERAIPAAPSEFELSGEILVSLGRISRTDLQQALTSKDTGDRPLGEILVQMGACTQEDIQNAVRTQTDMRSAEYGPIGLLGELLIEGKIVRQDDVFEALRMQKIARQRLDGILISMGICTPDHIKDFRWRCPGALLDNGDVNEEKLGDWVVMSNLCTQRGLEEAYRLQKRGRQLLGELLVNLKHCNEDDIQRVLSEQVDRRRKKAPQPEKLGELLVSRNVVTEQTLARAAKIQTQGREKLGSTLVNLGACTEDDFTKALELQFSWRESSRQREDKLGDELLKGGHVSPQNLNKALEVHTRAGKPLGQILVEQNCCPPEVVIETLIRRDERRHAAFAMLIQQHMPDLRPDSQRHAAGRARQELAPEPAEKPGLVKKVSSWFQKITDK